MVPHAESAGPSLTPVRSLVSIRRTSSMTFAPLLTCHLLIPLLTTRSARSTRSSGCTSLTRSSRRYIMGVGAQSASGPVWTSPRTQIFCLPFTTGRGASAGQDTAALGCPDVGRLLPNNGPALIHALVAGGQIPTSTTILAFDNPALISGTLPATLDELTRLDLEGTKVR